MKRIVSLLLAALTLSAAGCSKAPEALDMPSKIQSPAEQALPESGKRLDEIALPEAQTRQDQPVVTDQAEPEPDQTGAAEAEQAEPPAEDPIIPISLGFRFHTSALSRTIFMAASASEIGSVRSPFGIRYLRTISAIPCLLKYGAQS